MRRKGRSGASHRRGLGTKRTGGGHGRRFALRRRSRSLAVERPDRRGHPRPKRGIISVEPPWHRRCPAARADPLSAEERREGKGSDRTGRARRSTYKKTKKSHKEKS